ncbi:MAG: cobalamin-independent methionine synthase II family protein [Rhodospirillaceae bacterium]|nr:cobalamin-independent methionine synthase II family protein [Rhodospirillaceae bacterium]MYH39155.1 cobalamin-independent methionine synthase II family protein [Rhodospirillaceae bacterium]MYK16228.1 cobalamin-independent methionine synthase II family protein [Rhodospirillaceae bacterium]MYK59088.1 cobalamin-independent methionine synthase II family protein [Rhodospirillaceae bacterium]
MNDIPFPALPALPTMGVGSMAAPGWFIASWRAARKGEWGAHDIEELFEDATRIVVADQRDAGIDIIGDGELRRQRFVYEMFDRLSGLDRVAPRRRLGIAGYDMAPHFTVAGGIDAPEGLGAVEEFALLKALAPDTSLKVAIPGPLTFLQAIELNGGDRDGVLDRLVAIVRAELVALADAGADLVQVDEPGLPRAPHGLSFAEGADVIGRCLEGVAARTVVHVCFGNNAGRPFADRRIGPMMDAIRALPCEILMFEFANREMAELELMAALAGRYKIAAGVIDVKNFLVEDADTVARRIEQCLEHIPAGALWITADCGFSALPRYIAKRKLAAMTAGAARVREGL